MQVQHEETVKLDISLSPNAQRLLQAAAATEGRSVEDFILNSAVVRAEMVLADRTRFVLNDEDWTAFMEALDAPTRDLPRLERLFREPSRDL